MLLIYKLMPCLLRPLRPILTTPHGLLGLVIVFLIIFIPIFVTLGCVASITKPYPQKSQP